MGVAASVDNCVYVAVGTSVSVVVSVGLEVNVRVEDSAWLPSAELLEGRKISADTTTNRPEINAPIMIAQGSFNLERNVARRLKVELVMVIL